MAELPISCDDASEEIKALIIEKGIDSLTSKIIRKHLEAKFNCSLSAHKSEIDRITMEKINDINKLKEETKDDSDSDFELDDDKEDNEEKKEKSVGNKSRKRKASGSESSEFEAPKRTRSGGAKRKPANNKTSGDKPKKKRKDTAFTRICQLSDQLTELMGRRYMRRHDVVKAMWAYFKEHDLMDPKDRRRVLCDEPLQRIFGAKRIQAFGMMGTLKNHISDATNLSEEERRQILAELNPEGENASEESDGEEDKKKATKKAKSKEGGPRRETAFTKLMTLSDALAAVLGHKHMRRHQVVKAMWAYFKEHDLMDPKDRRMVILDDHMRPIFDGERKIQAFGMMRYLKSHMEIANNFDEEDRRKIDAELDAKYGGDDKSEKTSVPANNAAKSLKLKSKANVAASSPSASSSTSDDDALDDDEEKKPAMTNGRDRARNGDNEEEYGSSSASSADDDGDSSVSEESGEQ